MKSIKDTPHYKDAIHELNLEFGDFYLFDSFVIGEVHPNVEITWKKHFKDAVKQVYELYDYSSLIYITNRINYYTVNPSDWIQFFKHSYSFLGYGVISNNKKGKFSVIFERIFMKSKMKTFNNLDDAILWAKKLSQKATNKNSVAKK